MSTVGYTDDTALATYATVRGVTLTGDPDVLLTKALDYLESLDFIGTKTVSTQTLQWPRDGAYVDGCELDDATVPQAIIDAQHAIAIAIDQGYDPLAPVERASKREKVDVLEIEYSDTSAAHAYARTYNALLNKYLRGGGGAGSFELIR